MSITFSVCLFFFPDNLPLIKADHLSMCSRMVLKVQILSSMNVNRKLDVVETKLRKRKQNNFISIPKK